MSYKCEICGKTYETVRGRAACEEQCLKKQKKSEEELLAKRKQQDMEDAMKDIQASIDKTDTLLKQYKTRFGEDAPVVHRYEKKFESNFSWDSWPFDLMRHFFS